MRVVAIVPIKMNNERLPGKNVKTFSDGKPLIRCILETLCMVPKLDGIYVYCSNPDIQQYFPNDKIRYLKRSETLDLPTTKINEVLTSFARDVEADIYALAHATAPFIRAERFIEGIQAVQSGKYDSAFTVKKLQEFLWKDGRAFNYDVASIPKTQDLEPIYAETSGMYIYKADLIRNENRRIGHNPYIIEVSEVEACDIDYPEDFEIADAIYMNRLHVDCEIVPGMVASRGGGIA